MNDIILLPIIVPIVAGSLLFIVPEKMRSLRSAITFLISLFTLVITCLVFKKELWYIYARSYFGMQFSFHVDNLSGFIMLACAFFTFAVAVYSAAFVKGRQYSNLFFPFILLTSGLVNGAAASDNMIMLLFFWEGLLITLYGMIAIGSSSAFKAATKAFLICGFSDLCMMVGIALSVYLAGTASINSMHLSTAGLGGLAFVLLVIGAISKAGSMPFHSWIPDAAVNAPLPFMAFLPASLEKLLGIYLLARVSLGIYTVNAHSWASTMLMVTGIVTILFAVMMALIQKDYKRLLSYHAISQVGYMVLGIGTLVPAGIVGGLFHMINHALYKSCLFLTAGSVEKQTGTTDIERLGGIGRKMPLTFISFIIAAAAISGVPPFNGFFSKELVYDGALERGAIFYVAALLGSFFTAASFLKLGHSVFLGRSDRDKLASIKESPLAMTLPMVVIAGICIIFGVCNFIPLNNLVQPAIGKTILEGKSFAGFHVGAMLLALTIVVLIAAWLNHIYGVSKTKSPVKASDHIHYAPMLSCIYDKAEKHYFDPYDIVLKIINPVSITLSKLDQMIDWLYNVLSVNTAFTVNYVIRKLHTGNHRTYLVWSLAGIAAVLIFLLR